MAFALIFFPFCFQNKRGASCCCFSGIELMCFSRTLWHHVTPGERQHYWLPDAIIPAALWSWLLLLEEMEFHLLLLHKISVAWEWPADGLHHFMCCSCEKVKQSRMKKKFCVTRNQGKLSRSCALEKTCPQDSSFILHHVHASVVDLSRYILSWVNLVFLLMSWMLHWWTLTEKLSQNRNIESLIFSE